MDRYYIFTINNVLGGAGKRLIESLNYISKKDKKCYLICYGGDLVEDIRGHQNLKIFTIPPLIQNVIYHTVFSLFLIARIIFKERSKKIIGVSFVGNSGTSLAIIKKFFPGHIALNTFLRGAELNRTIIRSNKAYPFGFLKKIHVRIHKYVMRFLLSKTDTLITQSQTGLSSLTNEYPQLIPDNSFILPNNWNAEWITENVKHSKSAGIAFPPLGKNTFKICWIGRATMYVKGLDVMIRVLDNLKDLDIHVFIVGDGIDLDKAKKMVAKKNLFSKFTFYGYIHNPLAVLDQSDLLVVPSRSDPYPNVIFEAMAMGKPVLGSDVDGIPEILGCGELLFVPDKEGFLEGKIEKACKDPVYYKLLESSIKKRKQHYKFNWSKRLLDILES